MFANVTICVSFTGHIPIIAGVLSALVILLVVGVAFVCVHLKKQKNKPKGNDQYFPFHDLSMHVFSVISLFI